MAKRIYATLPVSKSDLWRPILSYIHEANAVIRNNLHKEMENCSWTDREREYGNGVAGKAAVGRFRDPYPHRWADVVCAGAQVPFAEWRSHASKRGLKVERFLEVMRGKRKTLGPLKKQERNWLIAPRSLW